MKNALTRREVSTRIKEPGRKGRIYTVDTREKKPEKNLAALLPIVVFLILYLGMGLVFEYILRIEMAF